METDVDADDLIGVQPGARDIVRQIASLCRQQFGLQLETLLVHGSAAKGGVIEGSSDVDFVAIVDPRILTPGGELPLDRAMRFHRDLARIEPAPFRYLQGYVCTHGSLPGQGFVPGAYQVILGSHDVPHATSDGLIAAAGQALATFDADAYRDRLSNALLNHGEDRLFRQVRWMCTDVWPMMFHVACLCEVDGLRTWRRTKAEVVSLLAHDPVVGPPLQRWMDAVTHHYSGTESVVSALDTLAAGVDFLDAVAEWSRTHLPAAGASNASIRSS